MLFQNGTPLPAAVVPAAEEGDQVTALFLCAATYRIEPGGLHIAREQRPLALRATAHHPPDGVWDKQGVSVTASGHVYPKKPRSKEAVTALRVGSKDFGIAVLGSRVWQRAALSSAPVPSAPLPFDRVAMTWDNAFGGMTEEPARLVKVGGEEAFLPAQKAGYPANYAGKGFFLDPSRAFDQPLPHLEDPEHPIRKWDDRPEPVCFAPYPMWGALRAEHAFHDGKIDLAGAKKLGNKASPRLTFDAVPPGTPVALVGMRPGGGLLSFDVPAPPAVLDLSVGGAAERLSLDLDSLDIHAETSEVRFLYRATARYDLIAFQVRVARLEPTETLR